MIYMTDSTGDTTFQTPYENDPQNYKGKLDTALKLMQCFTAETMNDAGLGRKTFNLELDENGLNVRKETQTLHFNWKEMYAAHRLKNSICLYADSRHAFLLPRGCGEENYRAAWNLIKKNLDPEKQRDHAK